MLFESGIITAASGSIGGLTASRNKGGMYFRAKAVPVDPGSSFQIAVRVIMAGLVNIWNNVLTQAQRDDWATYAANTPILNKLGALSNVSALNMYTRVNVPRLQAGASRVDEGPVEFNTGEFTNVTHSFSQAGGISVAFDNTDAWANEDDSSMILFAGRPQNPSINFFKGPYRLVATIEGDAITPPVSPQIFATPPFSFTEGQRMFARVVVARADGRLSTTQRFTSLAVV